MIGRRWQRRPGAADPRRGLGSAHRRGRPPPPRPTPLPARSLLRLLNLNRPSYPQPLLPQHLSLSLRVSPPSPALSPPRSHPAPRRPGLGTARRLPALPSAPIPASRRAAPCRSRLTDREALLALHGKGHARGAAVRPRASSALALQVARWPRPRGRLAQPRRRPAAPLARDGRRRRMIHTGPPRPQGCPHVRPVTAGRRRGRGRGRGQAMAMEVPVIATNFSGPTAFLHPDRGYPLPWDWNHPRQPPPPSLLFWTKEAARRTSLALPALPNCSRPAPFRQCDWNTGVQSLRHAVTRDRVGQSAASGACPGGRGPTHRRRPPVRRRLPPSGLVSRRRLGDIASPPPHPRCRPAMRAGPSAPQHRRTPPIRRLRVTAPLRVTPPLRAPRGVVAAHVAGGRTQAGARGAAVSSRPPPAIVTAPAGTPGRHARPGDAQGLREARGAHS